ncbi:MAG: toll/interleukin-1 receptor domain-containing protein [Lachnospiraceae bacterium]|nr:toll/interleukin-1 receptor domain-containing protein [Lachnospiraceae bacterium]
MSIFKCKMCGGTIEFNSGETVGVCDSCGTKQTLPRLEGEHRANLYDRANHFRRNNEYDKAAGIYEQILNEDTTDAEAYWSLVLCRYGIEYVVDPATHKHVPTVNRAQFTSIFDDDNYKSAIQYADGAQRAVYETEARTINEIQKGILAISQKEEPFDVFICYKETDQDGRRTQDSVLANDLYHQLTNEGFKVFFSRITLEDKLGTAYEPYIFAALNSAKVMVVLGTKPEYFNAVWVRNEWSRYLSLVKQSGGKKVLIPAYRDMDPYDLPEEFSHLQALDMSKLGFMLDLIRGIKKIVKADGPRQTAKETVLVDGNMNTAPLLKRAFIFLEDGNWAEADAYCEKVLDQEPENAQAYLGKLMAELHVHRQEDLKNCKEPFDNSNNYKKAVRFGNDELADILSGFIDYIKGRQTEERRIAKEKAAKRRKRMIVIIVPIIIVCVALFGVLTTMLIPRIKLNKAMELLDSGDYEAAYAIMEEVGNSELIASSKYDRALVLIESGNYIGAQILLDGMDYQNSKELLDKILPQYEKELLLSEAQVGSNVFWGSYKQDSSSGNEKEDIEWMVLDRDDERVLLISKYALDYQPFNTSISGVTWETCSLRKWLNEDFLQEAFVPEEQERILSSLVSVDDYSENGSSSEITTTDKVFLLNIEEVEKYFSTETDRQCQGTAYCYAQGAYKAANGNCWWWLRSPSIWSRSATRVIDNGSIDQGRHGGGIEVGAYTHSGKGAVRPAMWINVSQ